MSAAGAARIPERLAGLVGRPDEALSGFPAYAVPVVGGVGTETTVQPGALVRCGVQGDVGVPSLDT